MAFVAPIMICLGFASYIVIKRESRQNFFLQIIASRDWSRFVSRAVIGWKYPKFSLIGLRMCKDVLSKTSTVYLNRRVAKIIEATKRPFNSQVN